MDAVIRDEKEGKVVAVRGAQSQQMPREIGIEIAHRSERGLMTF
eukprot:CAMPEP_0181221088 /NCGR_PEP_ID=MMETSP1096-20121128/29196_1 /TAXON_ID=156174 ORGANISM="Chrysochromulina ericina, Strain CCMP281" /NCGR_SAMPLE_ID=MMETSP1096 /ASSEMBLY_ACC=CAM_ASM_000453 /LENGTH=43 /DNA_ID= /DNA_START= /DNA_END= /DNA_ORIENTATION=